MRRLELLHQPVDDALVPVVATEVGITMGALHFEHAVTNFQHAHVEGSTTEVEHEHGLVFASLVESVCECRSGRFVDDAQHLEAGNLTSLLGGGALCVVEICGHGDDGLRDGVTEICLGVALQLHECARADLLRRVLLAVDVV